jgi:hypothetical protein
MAAGERDPRTQARGSIFSALLVAAAALVVVLVTQQTLAASLGAFVAQLWVSVMDAVLRLIGAMFGG